MKLSEREQKIVLIKYIIHGASPFDKAPLETRVNMLKAALAVINCNYNEKELLGIGQACLDLQQKTNDKLKKFNSKHTDVLVRAHTEIARGNDSMTGMLGKNFVDEAAELLGSRKAML
jgi:hypothetical protein